MKREGQSPPSSMPPRPDDSHKGSFGTVLVIGGCDGADSCMVGGPAFSALGALRCGVGRVVMAAPRGILGHCLEVAPSATGVPIDSIAFEDQDRLRGRLDEYQAIVLGPGLGQGPVAEQCVHSVLGSGTGTPVILDADGLNIVARSHGSILDSECRLVLTPHPGEYDRLAVAMGLGGVPGTDDQRLEAARALSDKLGVVVVLKGKGTVVAFGGSTWVCRRGTPSLATAGTGDVLTGIIAGLVAQTRSERPPSLWTMACLGVWIHAVSGEQWSVEHGESGLMAVELAAEVPSVMRSASRS